MILTQGTFSFLPPLTDTQIRAQIQYALDNKWPISSTPTTRTRATPTGRCGDCRCSISTTLSVSTTALSFIVNRPAHEPGFRLDRQEVADRQVRYSE